MVLKLDFLEMIRRRMSSLINTLFIRLVFMIFEELINKVFTEDKLFETLLFDIEAKFEGYVGKYIHLNFDLIEASLFRVLSITYFETEDDMYAMFRKKLDIEAWIQIAWNTGHVDLELTRKNRSYRIALVESGKETFEQKGSGFCFVDEFADAGPLTEEEFRLGFAELASELNSYQSSKSKIAV